MSKQLSILKKQINRSVFKNESILLNRWIYKNKNQHRRSDYFRRMKSIQKHLRKFELINLNEWIKEYFDQSLSKEQSLLENGCFKILHAYSLLEKTKSEILIAYAAFRRQVQLTYFMSISLMAMGILARISFLIDEFLPNLSLCYQSLLPRKVESIRLPKSILSVQEFTDWNFSKEEISEKHYSTSSDDDVPKEEQSQIESLEISESFWSKAMNNTSPQKHIKRKIQDSEGSIRKKMAKKHSSDIDKIFSIFDN